MLMRKRCQLVNVAVFVTFRSFWSSFWVPNPFRNGAKMRTRTRPIKRRLVVNTENGRLLQPQEVLPTGAAQQEVVQGRFGLVFALKMRGYFDLTMFDEPYFALTPEKRDCEECDFKTTFSSGSDIVSVDQYSVVYARRTLSNP